MQILASVVSSAFGGKKRKGKEPASFAEAQMRAASVFGKSK